MTASVQSRIVRGQRSEVVKFFNGLHRLPCTVNDLRHGHNHDELHFETVSLFGTAVKAKAIASCLFDFSEVSEKVFLGRRRFDHRQFGTWHVLVSFVQGRYIQPKNESSENGKSNFLQGENSASLQGSS